MNPLKFILRTTGLVAGAALLASNLGAAEADALPTFDNNYVKFSAIGTDLDGSNAAFQARTQMYKKGAIGIEDLRFSYDLGKGVTMQMDARALAGLEDYLLSFNFSKEEVGSVAFGYKTARTFYDGAGLFFPIGNVWLPLFPRELYVDRGQFFVNATLALPDKPVVSFKYTNSTRDGRKDSTTYGDTNLTGIPIWSGPGASNPISASRKLLPAYIDLDERNEHWELSVDHKMGNTTAHVSVGAHRIDDTSFRYMLQNIGELTPFPAPTYRTLTQTNARAGSPRRTYVMYSQEQTGYHATATFETEVSEKLSLFGGLLYHSAEADIAMARQLTATIMSRTGIADYQGGFVNSGASARAPYHVTTSGDTEVDVLTGNFGARFQPMPTLWIEAALRGERYKDSGRNAALYTATGVTLATGAVTNYSSPGVHGLENEETPWTPTLDVRYTGIKNLSLYGTWEYRTSKQDEFVRYEGFDGQAKRTSLDLIGKDIEESHMNATIGANWSAHRMLSLRAELFTKDHDNDFRGYEDVLGRNYALNYDVYGTKLTATVKPLNTVSLTSRYILQQGKAAVFHSGLTATGVINGTVDGNDHTRHTFAQTITWNPTRSMYVQANGTMVYDQIVTMYPWVSGVAKRNLRNTDNNYVTGDLTVGFALDKKTDVRLQAMYYKADNFEPEYAAVAMPLGASARDLSYTAGFRRKLTDKTVLGAKLGYVDSKNDTLGGFADFKGPVGYLTLEHAF